MLDILININLAIFIYFIIFCTVNTMLLIASFPDIMNRFDEVRYGNISDLINNNFSIPMTVIMPAYNLSHEVFDAIASVLNSDYQNTNIIIVNDGSTDDSLNKMIKTFQLYKTPLVIKEKIKTAELLGYYESKT